MSSTVIPASRKIVNIAKCAGRYIFKWGGIVINWEITNQLNNELIQVILFLVNDNIVLSSYF